MGAVIRAKLFTNSGSTEDFIQRAYTYSYESLPIQKHAQFKVISHKRVDIFRQEHTHRL